MGSLTQHLCWEILCAEYGQPTEHLEPHPSICCERPEFRRVPRLQPGENILGLHLVLHRHQGTMMDFNLQDSGSVRSQRTAQSQVGYSPASESGYPQPSYHPREM